MDFEISLFEKNISVNEEDSNNWGLDSFGALGELSLFEMSFLIGEWLVEWADFLLFLFISPFFSLTTAHILSLGSETNTNKKCYILSSYR
jgi:hypothetical protein